MSAGPAVRLTARPPNRLFHLVLKSHDGRAQVPIPREKHEPVSDIDTVVVNSLKTLDPNRPIREADINCPGQNECRAPHVHASGACAGRRRGGGRRLSRHP